MRQEMRDSSEDIAMMDGGEVNPAPPSRAVATLGFGDDQGYAEECWEIYARQELKIGRAQVEEMLQRYEREISNEHITIRCVQFDEDMVWGVPPVIYVENLSSNGAFIERACDNEHDMPSSKEVLNRVTGSVPVSHNDKLFLHKTKGIFVQLQMDCVHEHPPKASLMKQEIEFFKKQYQVTPQVIGVGGHGTVYIAIQYPGGSHHACKVVPLHGAEILQHSVSKSSSSSSPRAGESAMTERSQISVLARPSTNRLKSKLHRLENEYVILKDLNHPNIVGIRQVFITSHHIYIMQELITGGDLLSFMENQGSQLGEARAAVITLQVLNAVEYLHNNGVVHRDIKPDNILMSSWKDSARVVLTDFGHAKRITCSAPRRMFTMVGTVGYTAPEVHKQNRKVPKRSGYSSAVDMWSIGTITAVLLTGNLIFVGSQEDAGDDWESRQAKLRAAARCDLSMIDNEEGGWATVGRRGKAFVKALLVLDENERLTAAQALQHSFIKCHRYAVALASVYERAVRDWKPRTTSKNIVQMIDTSEISSSPSLPLPIAPAYPTMSQYFDRTRYCSSVPRLHCASEASPQQGSTMAGEYVPDSYNMLDYGQGQAQNRYGGNDAWIEGTGNASCFQSLSKIGAEGSMELGTGPKTQRNPAQSMTRY